VSSPRKESPDAYVRHQPSLHILNPTRSTAPGTLHVTPAEARSLHPPPSGVTAVPDNAALLDVDQLLSATAAAAHASSSTPAAAPVPSASAGTPPQRSLSPDPSPPSSTSVAAARSATPNDGTLVFAKAVRYVLCCFLHTRSPRSQPSQEGRCTRGARLYAERIDTRIERDIVRRVERGNHRWAQRSDDRWVERNDGCRVECNAGAKHDW
jgi:hypothetical protein